MAVSTLSCWGPGPGTARQGHAQLTVYYIGLPYSNRDALLVRAWHAHASRRQQKS
jgi:hypothetical protein